MTLHRDRIGKLLELQSDRAVLDYLNRYNVDTDNILQQAAPGVNLAAACGLKPFDPHAHLGRSKSLLAELRMAYEGVAVFLSLGNPKYVLSCMLSPTLPNDLICVHFCGQMLSMRKCTCTTPSCDGGTKRE